MGLPPYRPFARGNPVKLLLVAVLLGRYGLRLMVDHRQSNAPLLHPGLHDDGRSAVRAPDRDVREHDPEDVLLRRVGESA
jgi:hypothetical protein